MAEGKTSHGQIPRYPAVRYGIPLLVLCAALWLPQAAQAIEKFNCTERWFDTTLKEAATQGPPDRVQSCTLEKSEGPKEDMGYRFVNGLLYWYSTERTRSSPCGRNGAGAMEQLFTAACYFPSKIQVHHTKVVRSFWLANMTMDPSINSHRHESIRVCDETHKCAVVLLPLPAAAAEILPPTKYSRHKWEIICDNERSCSAVNEYARFGAKVRVSRRAGPWEPMQVHVYFSSDYYERPEGVRLLINNERHGILVGPDRMGQYELNAAQVRSLLPALISGYNRIEFESPGRTRWPLSIHGATAVLLKMDEVQERVGTRGAAVRKGRGAERKVPPAPPIPEVVRPKWRPRYGSDSLISFDPALRRELIATPEVHHCQSFYLDEIRVNRLSEDEILVSTRCQSDIDGGRRIYWVAKGSPPFQPKLVTIHGTSYLTGELIIKEIDEIEGSCAVNEHWLWIDNKFVQTGAVSTGRCSNRNFTGPWRIPTFVTRVVP